MTQEQTQEQKARELTVREMSAMGGNARAKKLTKKRKKEIAQKAARTRWDKRKP